MQEVHDERAIADVNGAVLSATASASATATSLVQLLADAVEKNKFAIEAELSD